MFVHFDADEEFPKPGEVLSLRVFFPGQKCFLDLRGVVRWSGYSSEHKCFGAGVEFGIAETPSRNPWAA